MFTTAGATRLTIGSSDGIGVSPTDGGTAACAGSDRLVRNATATRGVIAKRRPRKEGARDMGRFQSIVGSALILMGLGPAHRKGQPFFTFDAARCLRSGPHRHGAARHRLVNVAPAGYAGCTSMRLGCAAACFR